MWEDGNARIEFRETLGSDAEKSMEIFSNANNTFSLRKQYLIWRRHTDYLAIYCALNNSSIDVKLSICIHSPLFAYLPNMPSIYFREGVIFILHWPISNIPHSPGGQKKSYNGNSNKKPLSPCTRCSVTFPAHEVEFLPAARHSSRSVTGSSQLRPPVLTINSKLIPQRSLILLGHEAHYFVADHAERHGCFVGPLYASAVWWTRMVGDIIFSNWDTLMIGCS